MKRGDSSIDDRALGSQSRNAGSIPALHSIPCYKCGTILDKLFSQEFKICLDCQEQLRIELKKYRKPVAFYRSR